MFHQLVSSLTVFLSSQAKASFLKKRRGTLVSHLPGSTHALVKHSLLTSPSSSSLFAKDVIRDSSAQVKENSQLKLLKNLFSGRGGKQSASSASASSHRRSSSSASSSSSSSYSRSASRSLRGSKRPSSSSPSQSSKVAFKGILRSPTSEVFFEVGAMSLASQGRRLSVSPLGHLEGQGGRAMGGGVEDGISPPVFITPSTISGSDFSSQLFPVLHQRENSSLGSFGSQDQGSDRVGSLLSWVLQPPVCHLEGVGLIETHDRSVSSRQVCPADPFQDGVQPIASLCRSEG